LCTFKEVSMTLRTKLLWLFAPPLLLVLVLA
jgi:hypothetical protein